ncbi:general substrate transporter [Xylogone sp. PMI_703]|nr:general substrate transporter [Xylogone sp. PMI_703]
MATTGDKGITPAVHDEFNAISIDEKLTGKVLNEYAREAAIVEHEQTVWEACVAYKRAIFWSLACSVCVVMEGYDTSLLGNFYAYPEFAKKYGHDTGPENGYQLTAPWQAGLSNASGVGAFFGALINGYLVNRFGHKRVLLGALVFLTGFVATSFSSPNLVVLCVGQVLCGFPWGIFATTAPAYASEVLPLTLRVYMTSFTNMCFIIGQLISAGVLRGLVNNNTQWSYRIPFAIQWVWPVILFPVLLFAPESPWHLVRKGRLEEAEASLKRLITPSSNIDTRQIVANIVHTNQLEEDLTVGTSYFDCFKGTELRRTEISCVVFAGQVLSGLNFAYNTTYFFQQVGLDTRTTYNLNVGGTGMALAGTLISWFLLMPYFGRRTLYLWGIWGEVVILYLIGLLNIRTERHGFAMGQAVLTLVWTFVFQLTIGQLGWALPAEMGSTRLRQKTIVLARNAYYIVSTVASVLQPYFMNPTQWNLKGYTGFVWGSTALITAVWATFRLPETRGRSFDDIDVLFAKKVPARKFASYEIDPFTDEVVVESQGRGQV